MTDILSSILDSWNKPVVFVDSDHVIRYMNAPAKVHYAKWGDVVGKSIFHCHNEKSCEIIRESFQKLQDGEDEALITSSEKHRVYMRAVRSSDGQLTGYYERYEPPQGK